MEHPPLPKMVLRGAFRRCAWCGGRGAFFTGWFKKSSHCQTCGLNWRRGDVGYELGAATAAAIICMGPLILALGVVTAVTWPDFDAASLFVTFAVGALLLPILLYPTSYTLWQALDLVMRPVQATDFVAMSNDGSVPGGPGVASD